VELSDIVTIKLIKNKKKSLLSYIGFGKKNERNYLAMFDEHYIYFMKDIEVSDEYSDVRKIGNKYNIKLLQNAIIDVS
jgi:hypothetical protein